MIDRKFIVTYVDTTGRLVHRANHDERWYWLDHGTWRLLARRPTLRERWA